MSSCTNTPNFNAWLDNCWGSGQAFSTTCAAFYGATNLVFGTNPPYYLDDFLAVYPKFFGQPTAVSGCVTTTGPNANQVTFPSANGLNYGQFVQAVGVMPKGSVITGISGNTITFNTSAVLAGTFTFMVYEAAPIPVGVILLYLNLAVSSLQQVRWQEMWVVGISLYIAHFLTLYAKSDASSIFEIMATAIHGETPTGVVPGSTYVLSAPPPGGVLQSFTKNGKFLIPGGVDYTLNGATVTLTVPTILNDALYATWAVQVTTLTGAQLNGAQIAAAGLAGGIQTNKSVGDVSVGYQPLAALEDWAAWGLTTYGQQLATFARVVGMGPMVIW